jgi:hypothetical protein
MLVMLTENGGCAGYHWQFGHNYMHNFVLVKQLRRQITQTNLICVEMTGKARN